MRVCVCWLDVSLSNAPAELADGVMDYDRVEDLKVVLEIIDNVC